MIKLKNKLTPEEVAEISNLVYRVRDNINLDKIFQDADLANSFEFTSKQGKSNRFSARTGAFEFKSKTGFGVIAKGTGKFERDAVIVCRGTASVYDGLTDINTGIQVSKTGYKVHAGFNRTFNDFSKTISKFIDIHQPRAVHCVGHSLGGALATLSADLVLQKGKQAALYTFGGPRVGLLDFANRLSLDSRMGIGNIHRVYHAGDPVAMLPLWPFVHAPQPQGECYIGKSPGFSPRQHKMETYIDSVSGQSWQSLTRSPPNWDNHVDQWLNSDKTWSYLGLNFYNLTMAIKAIKYAIKKVVGRVLMPVSLLTISGVTFLDQLSLILNRAANLSKEFESYIMDIMRRILGMVGVKIKQSQNVTHAFIRYVLNQLTLTLNRNINLALQVGLIVI